MPRSAAVGSHPGYSAALLAAASVIGVGLLTQGNALPLLLGAVTLAAWFGGARLGLGLTILFVLVATLGARSNGHGAISPTIVGHLLNFAGVAMLLTGLIEASRTSRRRSENEARARRQSEERYRLAVRGSHDGIWDWDLRTGRVFRSERLEEMLGSSVDEADETMAGFTARLHPEDRERVMTALRDHVERRFPFDLEFRLKAAGDPYRWFHACGQATWDEDGRATRMVGSLGDITTKKRAEEQLVEAKELAEAAGRSKDMFLAMLSHELRTPLTPAMLALSGMLDDPDTPTTLRPMLEAAMRGISLEARLVDDLLDVTRIGAGKLQIKPERLDAHAVIQRAVDTCLVDLRSAGVRLELDLQAPDHHVEADPARLQQVFWNLIKNAVKFAPNGTIAIRSRNVSPSTCRSGQSCFVVDIHDNGVGIEPELLLRVFDAFEQGGLGRERRSGGLGLGLAISRSIAEAHGGHLTAKSDGPGRGATFSLQLAVAPRPAPREITPVPNADDLQSDTIHLLLVEDDADTARVMARLLRSYGIVVAVAESIERAKEMAVEGAFDLLVSDLNLPDGSGLDLVRWLKQHRPMPAVALTGFGMDDDVERCRTAGFDAHLTKPIEFRQLVTVIQQVAQTDRSRT